MKRIAVCLLFTLFSYQAFSETFNFHVHVRSTAQPTDKDYIDNILNEMKTAGINKAVLISSGYLTEESEQAKAQVENDFVAQQAAKFPDVFIPACGVPVNVTWAYQELERCKVDLKMNFIKVHPFGNSQKMNFQNPATRTLFRDYFARVDALDMTVLAHSAFYDSYSNIFLSVLARIFPDTPFIFFHSYFYQYRDLDYALDYYRRFPNARRNIFLELSWTCDYFKDHLEKDVLLWYVRKWGIQNVVFGSDSPDFGNMSLALDHLKQIGFTNAEIEQMLTSSAQSVLQYK